jgi:hypothetical protein
VRYSFGSRSSGFSTSSGDVKVQNMSLAASGTYRSFVSTAAGDPSTAALTKYTGYGIAVNGLLPVITSGDSKSPGGSLTVTGEFAWGAGIGDAYSSWSGNLAQLSASSGTSASPTLNLDSGQGAIDSSGNFQLAKIQSWNAQLQYHFTDDGANFLTAGYGQLYFLNSAQFPSTAASSGNILYDRPDAFFINYVRDLTKQWRMGLEYSRSSTHYADGVWAANNRIMTNFWLRF